LVLLFIFNGLDDLRWTEEDQRQNQELFNGLAQVLSRKTKFARTGRIEFLNYLRA